MTIEGHRWVWVGDIGRWRLVLRPWTGDAADQAALDTSTRTVLGHARRLGKMRGADAPQLLRAYGSLILADYSMSVRLHRQGATQ